MCDRHQVFREHVASRTLAAKRLFSPDPARVLEDALTLTADDRARNAHELIHSVQPDDAETSAAWSKEIRRRVDEIEAGSAELEDWEVVRARLEGR